MFKKTVLATSVALGMGMAGAAQADLFLFNPAGGGAGGAVTGALIDEAPGNDLAIGGSATGGGAPLPVGTTINNLYQSNLNSVSDANNVPVFSQGGGGNFFTFVAGFTETVVAASSFTDPGTCITTATNSFNVNAGGFFKMCAQTAGGNDLAGTGFACAGNGILSGQVLSGNATQTVFVPPAGAPFSPLDQSPNGNQRAPTMTLTSSGAANLTLRVDTANVGYFPDLLAGATLVVSMTNTSNITPFAQVDPSFVFSINGILNGGTPCNIGAVNGFTGPDFQFQADANSAFTRQVAKIPEPATLALLGLGLFAMGGALRRRTKLTKLY